MLGNPLSPKGGQEKVWNNYKPIYIGSKTGVGMKKKK